MSPLPLKKSCNQLLFRGLREQSPLFLRFALVNALLLMALGAGHLCAIPGEMHFPGSLYSIVLTVGHCGFIALLLLAVSLPLTIWGRRPAGIIAIGLNSLALLFGLLNLIVFRQYKFHIGLSMINLFCSPAGTELVTFPLQTWLAAAGVIAAVGGAETLLFRVCGKVTHPGRKTLIAGVAIILGCFAALHLAHAWATCRVYPPILTRVQKLPYVFPLIIDDKDWAKIGVKAKPQVKLDYSQSALHYPLAPLTATPPAKPLNVLFILIDAWRTDSMRPEVMPFTCERARRGIVFRQHLSGGNSTRPGIFTLFYGIPASYWHNFLAVNREPLLMETLRRHDYRMGIFATCSLRMPEFDRTVFAKIPDLRSGTVTPPDCPNADLQCVREFTAFLDNRPAEKPFFGFLFFNTLHDSRPPRDAPRIFTPAWEFIDHLMLNNATDPRPGQNMYNNMAHYVDGMLRELFTELDRRKIPENTVIILTGDHGQEINDSRTNSWGHNSNFTRFQTQVPFIVFWPGMKPAAVTTLTSHFDVAPTLLRRIFNCQTPFAAYSSGQDLFDAAGRKFLMMANYDNNAIYADGNIYELSIYGALKTYTLDGVPNPPPLKPEMFKAALAEMSRFYR